ncbi:hypothetical protein C4546_03785 [Candidatus Parcubacteria bacterium]|jgi:hypothetical protein|nr:MAG: hypothetical protein C4546_03785 [Candidatus Parcubacteria bacterium]
MTIEKMPESKSTLAPTNAELKNPETKKSSFDWKVLILGIVPLIFAGVFWWTLDIALQQKIVGLPPVSQAWQFLIALFFFCMTLALFGVFAMARTRKHFWQTLVLAFLASIILVVFFPHRWASLAAAGAAFLGFTIWAWSIAGDVQARIKFQPQFTIHAGFGTGLFLLLISLSLCYYTSLGNTRETTEQVRQNLITATGNGINIVLDNQIPGYRSSMSLDEFLSLVATDKFGELIVPEITKTLDSDQAKENAYKQIISELRKANPAFENPETTDAIQQKLDAEISAEQQALQEAALNQLSEVQKQLLTEARREFLVTFKIEATGAESMNVILEKILEQKVGQYVDPYERLIPPILALSFFFIIEIISFVYRYLIFALAPIVSWVYLKMGLMRLRRVQTEVQKLEV